MTYTFKLARRLAASHRLGMLPVAILLFAGCMEDATAPGDPLGSQVAVAVSVNPRRVTIETNQLIRFLASGRNSLGDSVYAPITWRTTGGTILPDGRFSSAASGTFTVTGMVRVGTRDPDDTRLDTSVVIVVPRWPFLGSIQIAPEKVTLTPGKIQRFLVTGRLKDGRPVPVGTIWNATGGTIDAGGTYVAGDSAGTYHVIATNPTVLVSDTAVVTIEAPASPPEEPPAPPVLAKVTLLPASATLAPSTTRQFRAHGTTTTGDSVAVGVVFAATGGAVTTGGLYTAGSSAGTFRVIATASGLADTSTITVTVPAGSGASGLPFGTWSSWASPTSLKANAEVFSASMGSINATDLLQKVDASRRMGKKIMLAMTGGHVPYLTNGVFDRNKWNAAMQTYNTPIMRDAIAKGVADGTIIANSVMDEPQVRGLGDGNTWGPAGTMTKARVDSMCGYVKAMFPTLPVGVVHTHDAFEPTKSYRVCEFIVDQYESRFGSVTAFRDAGLALARRDGHAIAFSLNIMNGGTQAVRDGLWSCPLTTTGGRGTYDPNCRMTAAQVREYGTVLGLAGCGLMMWRYDDTFMAKLENLQAFRDVASTLANAPARSCRRT